MAYLGNGPSSQLPLRLEARKSFSLGIWIKDSNDRSLSIAGCAFFIVAKKPPFGPDDSDNLFENSQAQLLSPDVGYARFDLQASDLDHDPGEYPYSIVMIDADGYSSVIVQGELEIIQNTEFGSVDESYVSANPPTSLTVSLRGAYTIALRTGPVLAPGTTSFTDADKSKLDDIEAGAQVNVSADWLAEPGFPGEILNKPGYAELLPPGGSPGAVLIKLSSADGDVIWALLPSTPGGGALDATGVPSGYVPTANGVDSWDWAAVLAGVTSVNGETGAVTIDADDIGDGVTKVIMLLSERTKLAGLSNDYDALDNLPTLGTAAAQDVSAFIAPGAVNAATDILTGVLAAARIPQVSDLDGWDHGTGVPSGGADGNIYFQHS